ncbi:ALG3-domain-containing protein [Violaceomyces palustris]|uniref:ALG3-domain-containing protein n=1 Tax=Violaceomyces palustris TaxID=1673888 RepID=A0ACD0NX18_9BASI|nr:ALG3-domain-containing protein [Violaceomyces palustris]
MVNRLKSTLQKASYFLQEQDGYPFIGSLVLIFELFFNSAIVKYVKYTEIDFKTYLGQAQIFLDGQRNYDLLEPEGGTGPCVYPAGHLYFFSAVHWLTSGGKDILSGQILFGIIYLLTLVLVFDLYRQAKAPPYLLIPLSMSKRLHSIYVLRLFNDPVAMLCLYASLCLVCRRRWVGASFLFSLALSIKMNILLFLPAMGIMMFRDIGFRASIARGLFVILMTQVLVSIPFVLESPDAYLSHSFDLSRQFLYKWTVNFRFVSEEVFLSPSFSKILLSIHFTLLMSFATFRWSGLGTHGLAWIRTSWDGDRNTPSSKEMIIALSTCNLIGVLCSRSLHYQFYSWYFHQVPLLTWHSRLPTILKVSLPLAIEASWNTFPSTVLSSTILAMAHLILLLGLWFSKSSSQDFPKETSQTSDLQEKVSANQDSTAEGLVQDQGLESRRRKEAAFDRNEASDGKRTISSAYKRRIQIRRRLFLFVGKAMPLISLLAVIVALAILVMLPWPKPPFTRGVYVDENALQPGQAKVYWDYFDVTYADMISEKVERLGRHGDSRTRAAFVQSELSSYGLAAHMQNYNFSLPCRTGEIACVAESIIGYNAYARSISPRVDGREAIVLSASWKSRYEGSEPKHTDMPAEMGRGGKRTNVRGVASLLALARYLSKQAFWSKDLIFVVSDGYLEGMQAWTSSYFGQDQPNLTSEPIQDSGSQIWNALAIDYPTDSFSSLSIFYEGPNGHLPNLDVYNTLQRVVERVGGIPFGPHSHHERHDGSYIQKVLDPVGSFFSLPWLNHGSLQVYESGIRSAAAQMSVQSANRPSGVHGLFHRFHVDAITLYAVPARGPYGFYHMGRIVESYTRSMSNLLERLHHSQFFYLLVNPRRFAPLGMVILVPLMISIALTFIGLLEWHTEARRCAEDKAIVKMQAMRNIGLSSDPQSGNSTVGARTKFMSSNQDFLKDLMLYQAGNQAASRPVLPAIGCIVTCQFVGLVMMAWLTRLEFHSLLEGSTFWRLVASFSLVTMLSPLMIAAAASQWSGPKIEGIRPRNNLAPLIHAFALLQAGMMIAVLSLLNFSCAIAMGLTLGPAVAMGSYRKISGRTDLHFFMMLLRFILLLSFSPPGMLLIARQAFGLPFSVFLQPLLDWHIFRGAALPVGLLGYYPLILQALVTVSSSLLSS